MSKSFNRHLTRRKLFQSAFLQILLPLLSVLFLVACSDGGESSATCSDGLKNQNETDIDCGGICATCENSKHCLVDADCTSNHCESGACESYASETCTDQKKNQDETDTDCGGSVCNACSNGKSCLRYTDCESGFCDNGTCTTGQEDQCPDDPEKTEPGQCGCGVADTDSDSDGTADCNDGCPDDADKTEEGICGCGVADTDSDSDGTADCNDGCPDDADKTEEGVCGCGVADTDSDSDGTLDCNDGCPDDADKTEPGLCGCGVVDDDTDTDLDGTADCIDGCVDDPDKIEPGDCGCGVADIDTDSDGTADCIDACRDDPDKIEPGVCGCGTPDVDENQNGFADCTDDCAGQHNGTAELDKCGRCSGGTTGVAPCPVLTIEPEADAFVSSDNPDSNFGQVDQLLVRRNNGAFTFLRFNLEDLPPGVFVKSVTLKATSYCGFAWGDDGNVYTRLVEDDSWEENSITWNNMPTVDENSDMGYWWIWYGSGCAGAPKIGTNSDEALLQAVQTEDDGDGLISLRLDSPGYDTDYYSREHDNADDRPVLEVAYIEPQVTVLEPMADAEVSSQDSDTNYGNLDELRVDRGNFETFLKFDLAAIPHDANIQAVVLRAVSFDGHAWGGDGNVYTRLVTDDSWDEMTITWNNRPAADEDKDLGYWWIWYNHGANAPKVGENNDPALLQAVLEELSNDGIISLRLNSPGYWTSYYSRENSTSDDRPQLIIYY